MDELTITPEEELAIVAAELKVYNWVSTRHPEDAQITKAKVITQAQHTSLKEAH